MSTTDASIQVAFMPWAGFNKEITMGPVSFWPWKEQADAKVQDEGAREHLDKLFSSFVDHAGNPVDTITICSQGTPEFRELSDAERGQIRAAVEALIFSVISMNTVRGVCANNPRMAPPSADRYELMAWQLQPGKEYIRVTAGSMTHTGWKLGEVQFSKPWSVGGWYDVRDEELLAAFGNVFQPDFPAETRDRLTRSVEWFRHAHTEIDQVTVESKIVMMATAFEILLQFPRQRKRNHFVDYMEKNIANGEFVSDTRASHGAKPFSLTLAGCWAWDFYELRSKIVHGETIRPEDLRYKDWITHPIVADLVFWECLKRELYEHGLVGAHVKELMSKYEKMLPSAPDEEAAVEEVLKRWLLRFNGAHEALGWIPPLEERTKIRQERWRNEVSKKID